MSTALKIRAAQAALTLLQPQLHRDAVVGIGTGSTTNCFIDLLPNLKGHFATTVASSEASAQRLQALGITVCSLNDVDHLDFYVDGADEATTDLCLIKGGGAALTREKILAEAAKCFICIADNTKLVAELGAFPLPVEIIPMAQALVTRRITALGGEAVLREHTVTDNGGSILDVKGLKLNNPVHMEQLLNQIPGVITNGLFSLRRADILLIATETGVEQYRA